MMSNAAKSFDYSNQFSVLYNYFDSVIKLYIYILADLHLIFRYLRKIVLFVHVNLICENMFDIIFNIRTRSAKMLRGTHKEKERSIDRSIRDDVSF